MKKFFKTIDKILGITILVCAIGFCAYIGFFNPDLLKPTYTITLNADGAIVENSTHFVKSGNSIELPTPEKNGYIFEGWYNGNELWTIESKVQSDTYLVARWTPVEHNIKFVVNGIEHIRSFPYDSIPYFDGDLSKTPTSTISYSFAGWQPEITKVSADATYTATYTETTRLYSVSVNPNYMNACDISGNGNYEYGQNTTLSIVPKPGYNYLGLYKNGELYSTLTSVNIPNITADTTLEARFSLIHYPITYHDYFGTLANPSFYTVEDGELQLVPQLANGYTFAGWFTEQNGNGENKSTIDCSSLAPIELYAHYTLDTYLITYDLSDGDVSGTNPTHYTILDGNITLINPTKTNHNFLGWSGTGISGLATEVVIYSGSYGDRHYTAVFEPTIVNISFIADGISLDSNKITIERGQTINQPTINSSIYGMNGYYIPTWFIDSELSTPYTFGTSVNSDIVLYGSWEYLFDTGFMPYISKFNQATISKTLTITSEHELIKWFEFVSFHNIPESEKVSLTFSGITASFSSLDEIKNFVNNINNKSSFPNENSIYFSYNESTFTLLSIFTQDADNIQNASMTYNSEKIGIYAQQTNALKNTYSGRNSEFSNFNINNVTKTIEVSTTNQLVYALSIGLKPVPKAGSSAERVLNKAKTILNQIISVDMNEIDKTRAIYDWLITSVNYDHLSADTASANKNWPWQNYNSWYAEGVFDNGLAVCDGYSKAFIILAKLENIPAIRVTGDSHAWNRVYINGAWYGIDATHGDYGVNSTEVMSYTNFLFTDEFKSSTGYSTTDYAAYQATTYFDYYDYASFGDYDLLIDSTAEFDAVMEIIKSTTSSTTYISVEIKLSASFMGSLSGSISVLVSRAWTKYGINFYEPITRSAHSSGTVYLLLA